MRRSLLVAVAAAALAVPVAATAHPNYDFRGGCQLVAFRPTATGDVAHGELMVTAVATQADRTTPAPTAYLLATCWLEVNGELPTGDSITGTGSGVANARMPLTFTAHDADLVQVCWLVTVEDEDHEGCANVTTAGLPAGNPLPGGTVNTLVDPTLCVALAALAPGVPGVVDIGPDGDVHAAGATVWECPPYGYGPSSPIDNGGIGKLYVYRPTP